MFKKKNRKRKCSSNLLKTTRQCKMSTSHLQPVTRTLSCFLIVYLIQVFLAATFGQMMCKSANGSVWLWFIAVTSSLCYLSLKLQVLNMHLGLKVRIYTFHDVTYETWIKNIKLTWLHQHYPVGTGKNKQNFNSESSFSWAHCHQNTCLYCPHFILVNLMEFNSL